MAARKVFLLPSHLCLDAPLVAVVWTLTLRSLSQSDSLATAAVAGLGFCIWGIYLFDRLFDVRSEPLLDCSPSRHQFAFRNRKSMLILLGLATTGAMICLPFVPPWMLIRVGILAALTVTYYLVFRCWKKPGTFFRSLPWKEVTIAASFVIGIFLCLSPVHPSPLSGSVIVALFLLFLGNCLRIAFAETERDHHSDSSSFYASSTRGATATLVALPLLALFISLILLFSADLWIGFALVLTSTFSLYLNVSRHIREDHVQALADLALILPPAMVLGVQILLSR